MKADDGGPAFPVTNREYATNDDLGLPEYVKDSPFYGMTLRDYFAAKALTGIIAAYTGQDSPLPAAGMAATTAYDYADAMLAERAK